MVVVTVTVVRSTFRVVALVVVEVVRPPLYVVSCPGVFAVAFQSNVVLVVVVFVVRGAVGPLKISSSSSPWKHGSHEPPLMSAQLLPESGFLQKTLPAAFRLHMPVPLKQVLQLGPVVVVGIDEVGAAV